MPEGVLGTSTQLLNNFPILYFLNFFSKKGKKDIYVLPIC
jgi:hypothetical protein